MSKFYSQQGEDRIIFEEIYNQNPPICGNYIELGAMDGITYSNTKFFADTYNWNGVLIEPVPNLYQHLIRNRPNDECYNFAITQEDGEVEFLGNFATSARTDIMTPGFKAAWHGGNNNTYRVKSTPISKLVPFEKYPKIDFFSLDVEGGELDVLESFDWRIDVHLILIEINAEGQTNEGHAWGEYFDLERAEKCRQLLRDKGFTFVKRVGGNDLWRNLEFGKGKWYGNGQ